MAAKTGSAWTDAELNFLLANHSIMTNAKIAEQMHRSISAIKKKSSELGLAKDHQAIAEKKTTKTLCWHCQNACGGCSWSRSFTPVNGWKVKESALQAYDTGRIVKSYHVISCPEFLADAPPKAEKKPDGKPVLQSMDLKGSPCNKCYSKNVCDKMDGACKEWRRWIKNNHIWQRTVETLGRKAI